MARKKENDASKGLVPPVAEPLTGEGAAPATGAEEKLEAEAGPGSDSLPPSSAAADIPPATEAPPSAAADAEPVREPERREETLALDGDPVVVTAKNDPMGVIPDEARAESDQPIAEPVVIKERPYESRSTLFENDKPSRASVLPPPSRRGVGGVAAGTALALVIGLGLGAFLWRGWGEEYFPSTLSQRQQASDEQLLRLEERSTLLDQRVATLTDTITKVTQTFEQRIGSADKAAAEARDASAAARQSLEDLSNRLTQTDAQTTSVRSAVDELRSAIAAAAQQSGGSAAGQAEIELKLRELTSRIQGLPTQDETAALKQQVEALTQRLAAVERKTEVAEEVSAATTLGAAFTALEAKLGEGAPYAAELAKLEEMLPGLPEYDVLRTHAQAGVPTQAALAASLAPIMELAAKPDTPVRTPSQAGFWASLGDRLGSFVKVRRKGEADWRDVMPEVQANVEQGNLKAAVEEVSAARNPPEDLTRWRDSARSRVDVDAAVEPVSKAILNRLSDSSAS